VIPIDKKRIVRGTLLAHSDHLRKYSDPGHITTITFYLVLKKLSANEYLALDIAAQIKRHVWISVDYPDSEPNVWQMQLPTQKVLTFK